VTRRQQVHADPFAWEVAEHEEQLTRLWSALYAARAELLAVERLTSLGAARSDLVHAAVTAAWRWAAVRAETLGYSSAYASDAGTSDMSVDALVALAGWTLPLTDAQASRLTEAVLG
jgi:hypothetical protein